MRRHALDKKVVKTTMPHLGAPALPVFSSILLVSTPTEHLLAPAAIRFWHQRVYALPTFAT